MIKKTAFFPNTLTSLQTTLEAEERPTEGQHLLEEQILNIEDSLLHQAGTRRLTVSIQGEQNLEPRYT
jgi:hypothetical protein